MKNSQEFKIENGVPIPPSQHYNFKWNIVASKMKPGDSVVVTTIGQTNSIRYALKRKYGCKCVLRILDNGKYRVWRVG